MDFVYGGCRGNNNNFATEKKCRLICKSRLHDNMATPPPRVPATSATDKATTGTALYVVNSVCRVPCLVLRSARGMTAQYSIHIKHFTTLLEHSVLNDAWDQQHITILHTISENALHGNVITILGYLS